MVGVEAFAEVCPEPGDVPFSPSQNSTDPGDPRDPLLGWDDGVPRTLLGSRPGRWTVTPVRLRPRNTEKISTGRVDESPTGTDGGWWARVRRVRRTTSRRHEGETAHEVFRWTGRERRSHVGRDWG